LVIKFLLLALLGAAQARAAAQGTLKFPVNPEATLDKEAAFVGALLQKGGAVYFRLPSEALPSRDAKGQWRSEALAAALGSQSALVLRGDTGAAADADLMFDPGVDEGEGRWLYAAGAPRIALIENSSTVSPLSKGLQRWHWRHNVVSFAQVEAAPASVLDPAVSDLVVFSSPGWWEDFANPPGGPSRLPRAVSQALRDFVRQGGSALFIDIAQWDLEKAWPKTLNLTPLGPYQVSTLALSGGEKGRLSLAPVGVATDSLRASGAVTLLGEDRFAFPDGQPRPVSAAYVMPDPGGGQGWVAGLALHVFEQDDTLSPRLRRLLLNLLALSGSRRLATQGEGKAPTPGVASPTRTPRRSPTPSPSITPTSTEGPADTATPISTEAPTRRPTVAATERPTQAPMEVPTPRPTQAPPVLKPTPVPPALRPTPPPPTLKPTVPPPTLRPTATTAVLRPSPTRLVPTPRPALPTRVPSPVPTRAALPSSSPRPTARPTLPPLPTKAPTPRSVATLEEAIKNALGCLSSAPEPFGDGGVYLRFCLKHPAKVKVRVFDRAGHVLWQAPAQSLGAGQHQQYFDGLVNGVNLVPGPYLWEAEAAYGPEWAETRQASLTRRREGRH
jgi:hypothetical protein